MKQLYILLLERVRSIHPNTLFICCAIDDLFHIGSITYLEHCKLHNDFEPRKEDAREMFSDHPCWSGAYSWWNNSEYPDESKECRIKFLESIIESCNS